MNLSKKIKIPNRTGFLFIEVENIIYVRAKGNSCEIFTSDVTNTYAVSSPLKHIEERLSGFDFFLRIHQSNLINVNFITQYIRGSGGYIVLNNMIELKVADSKKQILLDRLGLNNR